ncbi:MAG TPA: hypothetical protein VGF97_07350 [Rhizomicrobium sp.]
MLIAAAPAIGAAVPAHAGVTFVPAKQLMATIEQTREQSTGIALMNYLRTPGYSAAVVRRTTAGKAELHERVDDIWYVLDGGATLVTGGSLIDPHGTEAGEVRGSGVSHGTERQIAKGDLIGIPAGTPHWVSRISGRELVYLVIKAKENATQGARR